MKRGIPQLDAIRGIAAATVAVWHWFSMARLSAPWFQQAQDFFHRGSEIAVTMFFVLSGCVLTLSIRRNPDLAGYFLRRVLRIMPLLIAVVSVSFIGMWLLRYGLDIDQRWSRYGDFTAEKWLSNVLLIGTDFNPPGWTLQYEVAAYLLLPFLVLALVGKPVNALIFGVLTAAVCTWWMTPETFVRLMPMFLPGVALAFVLPSIGGRSLPWLFAGTVAIAALIPFEVNHYDLAFWIASACAILIAGGTRLAALENGSLRWLGDISYGVYLWHYPVLWALFYLLGSNVGTRDVGVWLWAGAIGLSLTLLLSHLSYRYLEKPAMQLAGRRPKVVAVPAE